MKGQGRKARGAGVLMALVLAVALPSAQAKTTTWTGAGQNWNEAYWSAGTPSNGDDVVIDGNVALSNSTPILNLYTLNAGKTNTFLGTNTYLLVTNATIYGTVTHSNNLATTTNAAGVWEASNRVCIVAYSNFLVETGGQINVDGKGYRGALSTSDPNNGYGPGYGVVHYGAGSYGGLGGPTTFGTYGSSNAPVDPGSGGGGRSLPAGGGTGGNGGGAAVIRADGRMTVNGTISADGSAGNYGGGGSGGGIYIASGSFDGSGIIRANGGSTTWGCGGSGGRMAIVYTNASAQGALTPTVSFDAKGGNGAGGYVNGGYGTLYLSDATFFPYQTLQGSYWIIIPGFTNWAPGSLTVTNGTVQFAGNFRLNATNEVTVEPSGWLVFTNGAVLASSNLTVRGTLNADRPLALAGSLSIPSGGTGDFPCPLIVDANWTLAGAMYLRNPSLTNRIFSCGGDLIITNGGKFHTWSGLTNAASPDYGGLVAVTGDVVIANNSFFYPYSDPTNGGSLYVQMRNLRVLAGGKIDADGKGFRGSPAGPTIPGAGPGGGISYYGGGSYGGRGGSDSGGTYGSSNAPVDPGSGGGGNTVGGNGGGLVRVRADQNVTVDGTISANGNLCTLGGGGSGGGISIACGTFDGVGLVSANAGGSSWGSGGGGGRIAVVYTNAAVQGSLTPTVTFDARGGAGTGFASGTYGTLYLLDTKFFPYQPTLKGSYRIMIPGFTNWALNTLTISNGPIQFADGFRLNVTNDVTIEALGGLVLTNGALLACSNLTVRGTLNTDRPFVLTGSLSIPSGGTGDFPCPLTINANWALAGTLYLRNPTLTNKLFTCGGNLTITNGGKFYAWSGLTNAASPDYGGLVSVAGDVVIATNSFFYPYSNPTNGGSLYLQMQNLRVMAGGRIDADGKGFVGAPSAPPATGYGPGGGRDWYGGGSYGGLGGGNNGGTYGSSNAPVDAGSGGAGNTVGGNGGGLVRVRAEVKVTVDGAILANGYQPNNDPGGYGGGGSGGGIYIACGTLAGAGLISAKGGSSVYGWGGGGGRIAIWRVRDKWTGTNLDLAVVSGGSGGGVPNPGNIPGSNGTVCVLDVPESGTVFVVR